MSQSARTAPIVNLVREKHSNADLLSIIRVADFQCVINTAQWEGVERAFYIEPETVVDVRKPEFAFLKREDKERDKEVVRARRIRGEYSIGLLIPVPEGFEGDDGWDYLQLEHYEPEPELEGLKTGDCAVAPAHWANLGKYDLENFKKYSYLLQDGEPVFISEKMNGANMSVVYSDGAYHVKSRNFWKKDEEEGRPSDFWKALNMDEPLKKYLKDNPDHLVQGEMVGKVKGFLYGLNNKVQFRAFDIRTPDYKYMNAIDFHKVCEDNDLKRPQVFGYNVAYSKDVVLAYTDGPQENDDKKIREGVVIRPATERFEYKLNGRLILKNVSNAYLEKA